MRADGLALSALAAVGNRPRLSDALFRFTRWGNPFAAERFSWPYPMYDRMRADGPVTYRPGYRQWFVFGYTEVQEVLHSPDTSTASMGRLLLSTHRYRRLAPYARDNFARWLLTIDPPAHTRLRSAVGRAFTPGQVATYEPLVRHAVDELVAELPSSGEVDLFAAFTNRLPIRVITTLLGLPFEQSDWLLATSREIGGMLEPLTAFDPVSMSRRFAELDAYFSTVLRERRQRPTNDLISALVVDDDGAVLDDDEIISMIAFLLFAGHETVTGLLGNALVALARHTDQRALLRATPGLVDNAVEELLRFDPPVQVSGRAATAELRIGATTIPAGANVGLMIGAANRDLRRWPDADELRLDRPDPRPVSFGFGAHHCLGAALARMEARIALPRLLEHLGDYTIDLDRIVWKRSFSLRGPLFLPATIPPR